jgi:fructose 1,6-bisphosphate aldolase/phosphatase
LMPVKLNSAASLNYSIPIVSCLLFSMRNGKLTGPHDGFGTADWDLQRMRAAERAMIMRNQGFIHPATLVPDELEYNKGYEARMSKLQSKFRDLEEIMNGKSKAAATKAAATKQTKAGSSKH